MKYLKSNPLLLATVLLIGITARAQAPDYGGIGRAATSDEIKARDTTPGTSSDTLKNWSVMFPDDPNRSLALAACSSCHDLQPIAMRRGDKNSWSAVVFSMISIGARIDGDDAAKLIQYLSTYMDASKPIPVVPVNINTAGVEIFRLFPPLASHSEDILKKRDELKGFKSLDDLLQVKGLTKEDLDKVRTFLSIGS